MAAHADELIEDIRRGTVNPDYLPEGAPPVLATGLEPNPRRADELAAILRSTGKLLPREVWPNLRLLSCWKGGTMPLYLRKLPDALRRRARCATSATWRARAAARRRWSTRAPAAC